MKTSIPFPRMCPSCCKVTVEPANIKHTARVKYEGKIYPVAVPELAVGRCSGCGDMLFDLESDAQIDAAFRRVARLLSADDIRLGRKKLGLRQGELARALGVAKATVSRWETRTMVQSRASDKSLRAFFHDAHVRDLMRRIDSDPSIGKLARVREPGDDPAPIPVAFEDDVTRAVIPREEALPINRIASKFPHLLRDTSGEMRRYVEYAASIRVEGCLLDIK